jgi:hypothetical protein
MRIISAKYGNEESTSVIVNTQDRGYVAVFLVEEDQSEAKKIYEEWSKENITEEF